LDEQGEEGRALDDQAYVTAGFVAGDMRGVGEGSLDGPPGGAAFRDQTCRVPKRRHRSEQAFCRSACDGE
jgi:hypothetical protein